ncbi:MAG: hypothetical protein Q4G66_03360 [bacterium]|nr:hypothetical protein [bacterium]
MMMLKNAAGQEEVSRLPQPENVRNRIARQPVLRLRAGRPKTVL